MIMISPCYTHTGIGGWSSYFARSESSHPLMRCWRLGKDSLRRGVGPVCSLAGSFLQLLFILRHLAAEFGDDKRRARNDLYPILILPRSTLFASTVEIPCCWTLAERGGMRLTCEGGNLNPCAGDTLFPVFTLFDRKLSSEDVGF